MRWRRQRRELKMDPQANVLLLLGVLCVLEGMMFVEVRRLRKLMERK